MSFATMATLALGGAALGAIANPEDREKGALMGLGAGLLAPVAAPGLLAAPAAAPVVAPVVTGGGTAASLLAPVAAGGGTLAAGGTAAGGTLAATGTAGAAGGTAGAGILGVPGIAGSSGSALVPGVSGAATTPGILGVAGVPGTGSAGLTNTALVTTPKPGIMSKLGTMASKTGDFIAEETPDIAKQVAVGSALSALSPKPTPQAPQARSSALPSQASPQGSLYERAAMNQQARMKKRQGPRRFI